MNEIWAQNEPNIISTAVMMYFWLTNNEKYMFVTCKIYNTCTQDWITLHVLLRYESESERGARYEKTFESIVIIFSMYVNTFI